jgi:hypothetical protein
MDIPGITWKSESIEDVEILRELPAYLVRVLSDTNGFILREGAVHVRGACLTPEWHSLRAAWRGPKAFHSLYPDVRPSDIPFAQDQVGDQFLIRDDIVLRLSAETGEIERLADSVQDFFSKVSNDIEDFFNVGLDYRMQPGQLLCAYPPFCFGESAGGASLAPLPASEVILFHADLARQIRDVPDGGQIELKVKD